MPQSPADSPDRCSRRRRRPLAHGPGDRAWRRSPTPPSSCASWRRGSAPIVASSAVRAHAWTPTRAADAEATRQQGLLFREATAANLCLLGAGVLSSLVLAGPGRRRLLGADLDRPRRRWGSASPPWRSVRSAAMYGYRARESDRLRRWLTMRGTAEVARLETFRAIAARGRRGRPGHRRRRRSPCSAAICSTTSADGWSRAPRVIAVSSDRHQPLGRARHGPHLPRRQCRADRELRARPELDGAGRRGRRRRHGLRARAARSCAATAPTPTATRRRPSRSTSSRPGSTRSRPRSPPAAPRRCPPSSTR